MTIFNKENGAKKFKNICMEFRCAGITASQVNDVRPEKFNDPEWFMNRSNIAGAKGLINSFSFFFTGNMTNDEYKKDMLRIYIDKARRYEAGDVKYIATNFKLLRFYDRKQTKERFGTPELIEQNKTKKITKTDSKETKTVENKEKSKNESKKQENE